MWMESWTRVLELDCFGPTLRNGLETYRGTRNPVISPTCPGVSAARSAAAQEPLHAEMLYTTTGGGEVQACPAVNVVTCRGVAR